MSAEEAELPSMRRVLSWLDTWFHAPLDPQLAALIRIGVGLLVAVNFVATASFAELWWSESGFLPHRASKLVIDPQVWTVFDYLPHTTSVLWTCWSITVAQALLLAAGVFPRFQALSLFVWLTSFQHRNGLIIDGEDIVFRLMVFFLIFLPSADVWGFDGWLARKRGRTELPVRDGWALRLIQIQMCIVLWSAGVEKLSGGMWWGGTSMYYIMHLDDFFGHYPVPEFLREHLIFSRLLTWGSLWIEVGGPILIWFKETRRYALLAILALHLGIEYMMNLFLFEPIMIVGWLAHAQRSDLAWARELWAKLRGQARTATAGSAGAESSAS